MEAASRLTSLDPPPDLVSGELITAHALRRMGGRRIPAAAVEAALQWGRVRRLRGAEIYAIGRRDVERLRAGGVDLRDYEGVLVVCAADTGVVLTVYRNASLRPLRERRRGHRRAR